MILIFQLGSNLPRRGSPWRRNIHGEAKHMGQEMSVVQGLPMEKGMPSGQGQPWGEDAHGEGWGVQGEG